MVVEAGISDRRWRVALPSILGEICVVSLASWYILILVRPLIDLLGKPSIIKRKWIIDLVKYFAGRDVAVPYREFRWIDRLDGYCDR